MLLKKIILLIVSTLSFVVYSQTYFNVLESSSRINIHCLVFKDSIYTLGNGYNPSGTGTIVFSKYNTLGQPIIVDTFSIDGTATYDGYIEIYNNNIVLFNTTNNIAPYAGSTSSFQLSSLDTSFNSQWTTTFGGPVQEISVKVLPYLNSFYLAGTSNSWDNGNGDMYIAKTDTLGNILWENTYGNDETEYLRDIDVTKDGNLIGWGVRDVGAGDWDLVLMKLDTSGVVIWEKQYGSSLNDFTDRMTVLNDHSFLVYHDVDNGTSTVGNIVKYDGNGNLVWSKTFTNNNYLGFAFVNPIENDDGTILVNCVTKNAQGNPIVRVYLLDPFGNTLWFKDYYTRDDFPQYIYDIKPTTDGGYIMAGSAFPVSVNQQHAWLIKTNCNGEDGVQYPITGAACAQYDCTLYPIDANFTANKYIVDLAETSGDVEFTNTSANTTSRVWSFGDDAMDYTDAVLTHTYQTEGTYQAQLITFHGTCSDTTVQTIEVINSLGLTTIPKPTLKIFPNPSNGEFTIAFSQPTTATAQIIDVTGRVVSIIDINEAQNYYQIIDLTTGVYTIVINYGDGLIETKRIVRL